MIESLPIGSIINEKSKSELWVLENFLPKYTAGE